MALKQDWHISLHCERYSGGCVAARQDGKVEVRDTKLGDASPVLRFAPADWQAFVDGLKTR